MKKRLIVCLCILAVISLVFYFVGVPTSLPVEQTPPSGQDQTKDDNNPTPPVQDDDDDGEDPDDPKNPENPDNPDNPDDPDDGGETPPENPDDDDPDDGDTITLDEAKALIFKALGEDSIIAHMGKFKFNLEKATLTYPSENVERQQVWNGTFAYAGDRCITGLYDESKLEKQMHGPIPSWDSYVVDVFFAGDDCYQLVGEDDVTEPASHFDPSSLPEYLFNDDEVLAVYKKIRKQMHDDGGFTLTLRADWEGCFVLQNYWAYQHGQMTQEAYQSQLAQYRLLAEKYSADELKNMGWNTLLVFDASGDLIKAEFEMTCPAAANTCSRMTMQIEKTDAAIEQPQWVTDYLEQLAQTPEPEPEPEEDPDNESDDDPEDGE